MKSIKQTSGLLLLMMVLFTACAGNDTYDLSEAGYNKAVNDAKEAITAANNANYEWRDSSKMLTKAAEAAKNGDYKTAIDLVSQAKAQGELALAQSKQQASAGPR